jgi:hypothetical protein
MAFPPRYTVDPTFGPIPNFSYCGTIRRPLPSSGSSGINPSINFESYAPYIILRFQDPSTRGRTAKYLYAITTGNLAGENRTASIKSLHYEVNQSGTATVDIVDASGDDFVNFYSSLFTNGCLPGTGRPRRGQPQSLRVSLDFGWIFTGSTGVTTIYSNTFANGGQFERKTGPHLYFNLMKIDVNYEGGIWKYKVELKGADAPNGRRSASRTYGKSNQLVTLIDAASKHLSGDCKDPQIPNRVKTIRKNADGTWSSFKFENSTPNGPKGVYPGFNDDPLSAIRKNLDSVVTDRGRGVYMFYNVADESQTLYLVEGHFENCKGARGGINGCKTNFLGTYVVNGGDISPVISFSPKLEINATPTTNRGSVSAGSTRSRSIKIPECGEGDSQAQNGATIVTQTAVRENQLNSATPKELPNKIAKTARASIEAAKSIMPTIQGITADLTIQGDPRLVWPHQTTACYISVIFVNPFSLKQTFAVPNKVEGNWLASPPTNSLLSQSSMLVQAIEHDISDGKWETKLKIAYTPNVEAAK